MIRAGIGGWTYEPWRGTFYPPKLPYAQELAFASRALTTIEINGTFYRTQKPDTFRKWAEETPDAFVFSVKAPRYAVNKRLLAEAGPSIERFAESGLEQLGEKLGPILWQFAPTKKFDAADIAAFLALLPHEAKGTRLRHVLEVRHASFNTPEFIELAAKAGAAIAVADSENYPLIEEQTADFSYARLMKSRSEVETGYPADELDCGRKRAEGWGKGRHDAFVYFIEWSERASPAAARLS